MGQCEKISTDGTRCSNQAVPGTRFCTTHGRISFRPLPAAPPKPKAMAAPADPKVPTWQATAAAPGQTPVFPGLHADKRNILVAPRGVIWLSAEAGSQDTLFDRLVHCLGFLSDAVVLQHAEDEPQVRIMQQGQNGDIFLFLLPTKTQADDLSTFYDAAATATHLSRGHFFIGTRLSFVQYRDEDAPRGYDIPGFEPHNQQKDLLLVGSWGSHQIDLSGYKESSLADMCLRIAPVPGSATMPPAIAYVLVHRSLYAILARYFRAHQLRYRLARIQIETHDHILFEIQPNPESDAADTIPVFILDYLMRMPRLALLYDISPDNNNQILLQWQHRYPLHLPHICNTFTDNSLIILTNAPYSNLQLQPRPSFLDGDRLTTIHTKQANQYPLTAQATTELPSLQLPVLLRPAVGALPAIAAVLLTHQEVGWLRQLLYRLPGKAFHDYQLCRGDNISVLMSQSLPVEGIPFGIPLRRLADTELFLPLGSRFVPELPWPILRQALAVQDNVYTFLTESYRLDVARDDFSPLSRTLLASQRGLNLQLQPLDTLPPLNWTLPNQPKPAAKVQPPQTQRVVANPGRSAPKPITVSPTATAASPIVEVQPDTFLREQARQYEEAGDLLAAALCYELLHDQSNSSRCYRRVSG